MNVQYAEPQCGPPVLSWFNSGLNGQGRPLAGSLIGLSYPGRVRTNRMPSARNFHELGNERDPIIGNQDGTLEFKIPKRPIRKKITGLPAFTTVRGGAYFFLPGIKALRYLATLDEVH